MDTKEVKYLLHVLDSQYETSHLHTFHFDSTTYLTEPDLECFLNYTGDLHRILYVQELIFINPTRMPNVDASRFQQNITWMLDFTGCAAEQRYHESKDLLLKLDIPFENVHVLVNSRHDYELVKSVYAIPDITVTEFYYGELIALREICSSTKEKRFLSLMRNFNELRLANFVDLHRRGILNNSYYSFFNIKDVYVDSKIYYTFDEIDSLFYKAFPTTLDREKYQELLDYWTDNKKDIFYGMPYSLDGELQEVGKIAEQVVSRTLEHCYQNSYFSLLTETHIHLDNSADNSYFSMTEKTAKSIYYRHPFVVYSDANFLKRLRQSGYQTFSSCVDESYDKILNPIDRILKINDQVEILNNMDIHTFKKHMLDLSAPAAHNYKTLVDHFTNLPSRVTSTKKTNIIPDMIVKQSSTNWF